ncbi:MAG: glycosyltransferase [Planctomycetota bacterium]|nr:glycosyltransferase [Planctomycetota bacterium]
MRRLHVCQLITELAPAGAERCVYELARRLDGRRFDVQVVSLRGGAVADRLHACGVKVSVLGVRGRWDLLKLATLTSILRRERIDLLHTHLFHADLAGRPAAYLASVPHIVHTVHVAEGRFRPWQFAAARLLAGCCDRIICVSESVRSFHARRSGLPLRRYSVVPNGIDAAAFARDEAARSRLRAQWGVGPDEILLAAVGRLDRQKGTDVLLAAMEQLTARKWGGKLVLAGDGPERRIVENFIAHTDCGKKVRLLGFVDDVQGLLSAADIFVMPSRWEGWPLALAEAMAAQLPIVASDAPGICDVLVDGQTGLMVLPEDAAALAKAIERLAGDAELRTRLAQAARREVVQKHSIEKNIARHEEIYEEVANSFHLSRAPEFTTSRRNEKDSRE